ncbi:hypothetical protein T484DRAFT_1786878 [Baffinella frigidus]|nr:hypothetical protein T484DRAFT_1786878 [Cryptophyta sp. CCMP2293]
MHRIRPVAAVEPKGVKVARAAGLVAALFCVAAVASHSVRAANFPPTPSPNPTSWAAEQLTGKLFFGGLGAGGVAAAWSEPYLLSLDQAGFSPMDSLLQTAGRIPVAQAQMYMQPQYAQQQQRFAQQLEAPVPYNPADPPAAPPSCEAPSVECMNAECMGDVGCSEVQGGVEVCGCQAPPPPAPPPAIVLGSPEWQEQEANKFEAPDSMSH